MKGCFAISRLLVSDFLIFNVFFLKFNKKAQSSRVQGFGVLSPGSWEPGPGDPGSWVPGSGDPSPWSRAPGPASSF